jgi:8-oxo-dGTP diphosphatase
MYSYRYPHPAVATDICAFAVSGNDLAILLIRRSQAPFKDSWALPGGFLGEAETLDQCAARELAEETGLSQVDCRQFATFSAPDRDPRERVISVAYLAMVEKARVRLAAGSDAAEASWFTVNKLPTLAFDHAAIVRRALAILKDEIWRSPLAFATLPSAFSLSQAQHVFEVVEAACARATRTPPRPIDKRNFRKWLAETSWLKETDDYARGQHRPAQLFRLRASSGKVRGQRSARPECRSADSRVGHLAD